MEQAVKYRSFLVRVSPRTIAGARAFSVTVENVATGERRTLADLRCLVDYLAEDPAPDETLCEPPQPATGRQSLR